VGPLQAEAEARLVARAEVLLRAEAAVLAQTSAPEAARQPVAAARAARVLRPAAALALPSSSVPAVSLRHPPRAPARSRCDRSRRRRSRVSAQMWRSLL
jgi:hypothetical protein